MRAPANIATGQASINNSTATRIVSQRPGRQRLVISVGGVTIVGESGVTTSTGFAQAPVNGVIEVNTEAEVWLLSSASFDTVSFIEYYT